MKKFTTLEEDLLTEAIESQKSFNDGFEKANLKLEQIKNALEDFKAKFEQDPRNWGYAGSMEFINKQLDEILEHLNLNDENREFTTKYPGAGEY